MRKATITSHDLQPRDRFVRTSMFNPFPFQMVQRIDRNDEHRVYYVYTHDTGWYYCVPFDEPVEILID